MQQGISLLPYNTFGIDVSAEHFMQVTHEAQLPGLAALPQPLHILGGGSNILLTASVTGTVVHNRLCGLSIIATTHSHVYIRAAAGQQWHSLVMYAVAQGWGGIENLALIPGTVGASPMQNIGAYGVEVKDVIESVTYWHLQQQQFITLSAADCQFGYRDSIFKQALLGQAFITSVVFRLAKAPVYNTSYGAIEQELAGMGVTELSVAAIAQAVINIRSSKLPNPKEIGNAGSFFKNPTIPISQYQTLAATYPTIPSYPVSDTMVKVPAGWLIEQCGWKGYRRGDTGVHARQALVLVNYGHARGRDIWQLSTDILASVHERFSIHLEREVQVW